MNKKTESQKALYQLGLPPMELAEPNTNDNNVPALRRCFCMSPLIQRSLTKLIFISLMVATFIIFLQHLQSLDKNSTVEIVVITDTHDSVNKLSPAKVYAFTKNKSAHTETTRIKRETNHRQVFDDDNVRKKVTDTKQIKLGDEVMEKARKVIINDENDCSDENKNEICKALVEQLRDFSLESKEQSKMKADVVKEIHASTDSNDFTLKELFATAPASSTRKSRSTLGFPMESREGNIYGQENLYNYGHGSYPQAAVSAPLTDTCLLARLLKHNHGHVHGVLDVPSSAYLLAHDSHSLPYSESRYAPHTPFSYFQIRDNDGKHKLHPQDIDIFTRHLTPRPEARAVNSTTRDSECDLGTLPCDNGEVCINENQWCDGRVDCSDVSDESSCSCKARVDKFRLCDGYFDCPFGEDEMGCYGCSESMFSCEDVNMNSRSSCFTKEQRCNNVADCTNHKDEADCTMLAPTIHTKPLFAVSHTEGYLQRNFKGDWYAVCQNPYMWAHDACRRETGLIIRPPFIQLNQVDPMQRVRYLNTGPDGTLHISHTCFNSSAVYVTCPDLLCGTRVLSTSQLIKENADIENHLFGRNKRYLLRNHPYPMIFYSNRNKRDVGNKPQSKDHDTDSKDGQSTYKRNKRTDNAYENDVKSTDKRIKRTDNAYDSDVHSTDKRNTVTDNDKRTDDDVKSTDRNKRTESRVVGGRPSQPAAWPWMIAMYRDGLFHCGGVILTQSWILSAAHCVSNFWEHYYEIKVGMLRRFSFSPQEQNHQVTHVIVNQHYNKDDMKNDLSMLRVSPDIQFSRWVRPICLPGPNTAGQDWLWGPPPGTICTAVGWGATVEHGPDPDHMREVEMPVWDSCKHREDRAGKEICAGLREGGKDACQGDSGGPLLCKNPLNPQQWYMAGIVSHGEGCGRENEPGVYTRVSIFVKWIKFHISSRTLPTVQPKQTCPGFKCISGISKCIPNKRVCDKIVDCLGGEDEIRCEFMKSTQKITNLFLTTPSKTTDEHSIIDEMFTREAKKDVDQAVNLNTNEQITSPTQTKYTHENSATTIKTTKFKFDIDDSSESESSDASTESTITDSTRGDMEMTSAKFPKESLNARSSTKDSRETDINEDWSKESIPHTTFKQEISTEKITHDSHNGLKPEQDEHSTESTHTGADIDKIKSGTHKVTDEESDNQLSGNKLVTDEDLGTEEEFDDKPSGTTLDTNEDLNTEEEFDVKPSGTTLDTDEDFGTEEESDDKPSDTPTKNITNTFVENSSIENGRNVSAFKLEPARIRSVHRIPNEFECRRIFQIVPQSLRCDRKADCEDGTDELSCTCVDYILQSDKKLICNGLFDCADGLDEMDCFDCPENHFLCKRSQLCVPSDLVCDGRAQCPQGEDEMNCFALTNGRNMMLDVDGRPKISLEGFLTKKHGNHWQIMCDDNFSRDQQEQAADHICRYLGFSSANRFFVKHVNIKEEMLIKTKEDARNRRETNEIPVHFAYRNVDDDGEFRDVTIQEPEFIKERCVPNVTKTCMSLFVFCDHSLFTDFDVQNEVLFTKANDDLTSNMWPWVAKVYADGVYKCSGILIDLSWALVSHSCLWDTVLNQNFVTVALGSHKTLDSSNGMYEQIYQVDAKKHSHHSKTTLLHLNTPAEYSTMVKPMIIPSSIMLDDKPTFCVAVGQNENNSTISIFLEETNDNCDLHHRCFRRLHKDGVCERGIMPHRQWAGIISCHGDRGWYPAASFEDSRGECGIGDRIIATEIHGARKEIAQFFHGKSSTSREEGEGGDCEGTRCSRGRCVELSQVCDGIGHCEDLNDEADEACQMKAALCSKEPYHRGCECTTGQIKCHNGNCVAKELFGDGKNDCGDGTDEPTQTTCAHYLAKVKPARLCDGILNCKDRSDEDPMFCKCFAKDTYKCKSSIEVDHCVSYDMVCDGNKDCAGGDDESVCIALSRPKGAPQGTGQVIIRSHGAWHSKCYPKKNHTRLELEAICREVGFISGHARLIKNPLETFKLIKENTVEIDGFDKISLNNQTTILVRNTNEKLAKAVFAQNLDNCFPVFIECL